MGHRRIASADQASYEMTAEFATGGSQVNHAAPACGNLVPLWNDIDRGS